MTEAVAFAIVFVLGIGVGGWGGFRFGRVWEERIGSAKKALEGK